MKPRLIMAVALTALVVGGLLNSKVDAQGVIRLRLPFDGTRRLTAYVDHRSPYQHDGNMFVYTGEERLSCVDCNQSWTNQGPYCYDGHDGTDYAVYTARLGRR